MKKLLVAALLLLACDKQGNVHFPAPNVNLHQYVCDVTVLLSVLADDEELVAHVLDGSVSLEDAIDIAGAATEQVPLVKARLEECHQLSAEGPLKLQPVLAPPPAYGNKVM